MRRAGRKPPVAAEAAAHDARTQSCVCNRKNALSPHTRRVIEGRHAFRDALHASDERRSAVRPRHPTRVSICPGTSRGEWSSARGLRTRNSDFCTGETRPHLSLAMRIRCWIRAKLLSILSSRKVIFLKSTLTDWTVYILDNASVVIVWSNWT